MGHQSPHDLQAFAVPNAAGRVNAPITASPEFMLLCLMIGRGRSSERIEKLFRQSIDWMALANLAECHGVRPQLRRGLSRIDSANLPAEANQLLDDFQKSHMISCLRVGAELLAIAKLFEAQHVRFATFKGAALACSLYGDISGREYSDVDLIVHEADLEIAESCVRSRNYRAISEEKFYRSAFLAYQRQCIFQAGETLIDLHWDFSTEGVPFPIRPREIWGNLGSIAIAGRDIPTLGRNELALFLAGHGTKEGWRSLAWVCDFAEFVRANPGIDWISLWRRCAQKHCGHPILLGCTLASRLLDAPVEKELLACADREPAVQALADAAIRRMINLPNITGLTPEDFLGGLDLCETWTKRPRSYGIWFRRAQPAIMRPCGCPPRSGGCTI